MARCLVYEKLYLDPHIAAQIPETADLLKDSLVALYASILTFLARASEVLTANTLNRIVGSIFRSPQLSALGSSLDSQTSTLWHDADVMEIAYRNLLQKNLLSQLKANHVCLRSMLSDLDKPIQRIDRNVLSIDDKLQTTERLKILRWISRVEYQAHHDSVKKQRLEGTGQWLIAKSEFQSWQKSSESSILWLHGIPGCGKTHLASLVIDTVDTQNSANTEGLAYFYCKRDNTEYDRQDPNAILAAIVKQLARPKDGLPLHEAVVKEYKLREEDGFSKGALQLEKSRDIIIDLANFYRCTTIILDALDECDKHKRGELIEAFRHIIKKASNLVRILISSRDDDDISYELSRTTDLRVKATDNRDIEQYVNAEVSTSIEKGGLLRRVPRVEIDEAFKSRLATALINGADGM